MTEGTHDETQPPAAASETQSTNKTTPTTADLLSLIRDEIAHENEVHRRPGWSAWALLGSFVVMVGALLNQIGPNLHMTSVAMCAVGALVLWDVGSFAKHTLSAVARTPGRFFTPSRAYGSNRLFMLVNILRCVGISVAMIVLSKAIGWSANLVSIIYGGQIGMLGISLYFVWTNKQWISGGTKSFDIKILTFSGASGIVALAFLIMKIALEPNFSPYNLRAGATIAAIVQILVLMSSEASTPPLVVRLAKIRRELVLGHITNTAAAAQIEMEIDGVEDPGSHQLPRHDA